MLHIFITYFNSATIYCAYLVTICALVLISTKEKFQTVSCNERESREYSETKTTYNPDID
ncbi:hypothetical protein K450DRAFT_257801 [Umbelopsis ramanniana AG]|uniref:Uncharacterized protein n=1 Tax=Umbelopsis ramanniana AG TaxID=1314678 RepID=A0AAD5H9R6_UMBRA|nr:uncharacterized protein K450DRAFT_257801 [Umbelopsis ramanniana AG]KAI8576242.1 hypothetical protein K450DRAFT_257801 [Umbelopsis ramanniana AG]